MKTLKIGVCGVGNVGGAVLENLANSPSIVEDNGGVRIEIIQAVSYTHLTLPTKA